ncbi:cell division protein SepF [Lentilactobacillus sp. Marseille-Q4993]|uniref:cell division protein SepF n=1 Tax=Lentilactobacillus sp. Marseille-Q4993 TaxID=3039492 RepID=UPI0024BCCF3D|nr:cell division protein SepF [Lentilactobacillus sp. Marseille-Q4993]
MSQKFNLANFFGMEEENNQPTKSDSQSDQKRKDNIVLMSREDTPAPKSRVIVFEPVNYSDADMIATKLMDGYAVIIKLGKLDVKSSARMVDFLNGTIFAIHGSINRLDTNIFICAPNNFQVTK